MRLMMQNRILEIEIVKKYYLLYCVSLLGMRQKNPAHLFWACSQLHRATSSCSEAWGISTCAIAVWTAIPSTPLHISFHLQCLSQICIWWLLATCCCCVRECTISILDCKSHTIHHISSRESGHAEYQVHSSCTNITASIKFMDMCITSMCFKYKYSILFQEHKPVNTLHYYH